MIDQINKLIGKKDEAGLIALLKTLTAEEKKLLAPEIRKALKAENSSGRFDRYSHNLYQLTAFVCFNRSDFERIPVHFSFLHKAQADKVLEWYCPAWFSEYMNANVEREQFYLPGYEWVMELTTRGQLQPSANLIAIALPRAIYDASDYPMVKYLPENLLKYPVTLKEHIWHLFEFETGLYFTERFFRFDEGIDRKIVTWMSTFKDFTSRGLLDRQRVLRECLVATTRNFNKLSTGWFAGLFEELEPTVPELLSLEKELLHVLTAAESKALNMALKALKMLVREPAFDAEAVLDSTPLLLASDVQSVVTATLSLLEELTRQVPTLRARVALLLPPVFIHSVEQLQTRAARLLARVGDPNDSTLRTELGAFHDQLLSSPRKLLENFLDPAGRSQSAISTPAVSQPDPIPFPATLDDVIFLSSQAFDNNEPWHFDLLPAALVSFAPQLKPADLSRLQPAFQRAVNVVTKPVRAGLGELDRLLAVFFIAFGNWLTDRYPKVDNRLDAMLQSSTRLSVKRWGKGNLTDPYPIWLQEVLEQIWAGNSLPLLATPTHEPCWVDPATLAGRVAAWEAAGKSPSDMDWQIALSRCYDPDSASRQGPGPQTFEWKVTVNKSTYGESVLLEILRARETKAEPLTKKLFSFLRKPVATSKEAPLARYLHYDPARFDLLRPNYQPGDLRRILALVPNDPDRVLARVIAREFHYSKFFEAGGQRSASEAAKFVYSTWSGRSSMAVLFLAACLLNADKTIAAIGAETWLRAVSAGRMDNASLGQALGRLEQGEYAPLKRLTDLITLRLFNVSPLHNQALRMMIEHMLPELPEKPIKNMKTLNQIYAEIITL